METFERMTVHDIPKEAFREIKEAVEIADNRIRCAYATLMQSAGERLLQGPEIYELCFALSSAAERIEIAIEALGTYKPEVNDVDD